MKKEEKYTLLVTVTTAFLTTYTGSALNLAIPGIEKHFGIGAATVGWVVTSYILSIAALNVPMGKIADERGRRKMLMAGLGVFACASFAAAFSVSISMLMTIRVIQGVGAAMLFSTNNAILLSVFPEEKHGSALGKSVAATYTGLSLGPVIGGVLNQMFGWQSVFITGGLVGVMALFVAVKGLPKTEHIKAAGKMDFIGLILFIPMITAVLYGLTDLSVKKYAWIILLAGLILGVLFVINEKKAENPLIRVTMFSEDRVFTLSNIAAMLNYGSTFAISYLLSIYLQAVQGYGSQAAGLILIAQPVVMALLSPRMGGLSDRIEPYKLATAGMAFCTLCLLLLTRIGINTGVWYIIVIQLLLGVGFAMFSSPNTKAIMDRVSPEDYGVANSITATMRNLGQGFSMAIVTIVIGFMMGTASLQSTSPQEVVRVMRVVFIINIVLCGAATLMSLARGKEKA